MTKKEFPTLSQDHLIDDYEELIQVLKTKYEPPLSPERISTLIHGFYLGINFMQENGLTTRQVINKESDMHALKIYVRDLTAEGLLFYRTNYQKYLEAIDKVSTLPEKALKRYLMQ